MALPKIDTPTFMLELPSTKETVKYRPFTVKEEKILLMASQSEDEKDIQNAIEQILTNCVVSNIKIKSLAPYDIEYLFLNLRAKSVNNIIELKITDDDDGNEYEISINLDDIKVTMPERNSIVQINDSISLVMKDPDYATVKKLEKKSEDQMMNSILIECIDQILVDDDVILLKDHTKKEQDDFINSFSSKDMRNVEQYFNLMPKLSHNISYTREDGTEVTKTLEGMQSFFT
jgi:hypothetical protein